MSFTPTYYPNEPVITDENYLSYAPPDDVVIDGIVCRRGRILPDPEEQNALRSSAREFNLPLIPESEWEDRIQEMVQTKTRISDLLIQAKAPVLNQASTNYCWANGPVSCLHALQVVSGGPFVYLSPASVAAPIKNFRNEGGWGYQALDYIIKNGITPAKYWPPNAISRGYFTEANQKIALRYKVTEWLKLEPRDLRQLMTCLLLRMPVAVGYNWWSHEVAAVDPVNKNSGRILNSWGIGYGDNGYAVLTGNRLLPDDAVVPLALTPQWYTDIQE